MSLPSFTHRSIPLPSHYKTQTGSAQFWDSLCEKYGPIVIGDGFADSNTERFPPLCDVGWCSLYPASLYLYAAIHDTLSSSTTSPAQPPLNLSWPDLVETFWKVRGGYLTPFREFLERWKLCERFHITPPWHDAFSTKDDIHDQELLGLHIFHNWDNVDEYILRWADNHFIIRNASLRSHRLVTRRTLDLVCSELLSNAFTHTGSNASAFILAKLCTRKSAAAALAQNAYSPYLTSTEHAFFNYSVTHDCPVLQLCIGDTGWGFAGNPTLRDAYASYYKTSGTAATACDLLHFALSGHASVTTHVTRVAHYEGSQHDGESWRSTVHGLPEVRRFVQRHNAYWRIHTGNVTVSYDFLTGASPVPLSNEYARPVQGALHYFMFPVTTQSFTFNTPSATVPSFQGSRLKLLRISSYAVLFDAGKVLHNPIDKWVLALRKELQAMRGTLVPVLLDVAFLDTLNDKDLRSACIEIVHQLFTLRDEIPIFISRASDKVYFEIRHLMSSESQERTYFIVPFLSYSMDTGRVTIDIVCTDTAAHVSQEVARLLLSEAADALQSGGPQWEELSYIADTHPALFQYTQVSSELALRARSPLGFDQKEAAETITGSVPFSTVFASLKPKGGIATSSDGRCIRLGKRLRYYFHLARAHADNSLQTRMTEWLQLAMHWALSQHQRRGRRLDNGRSTELGDDESVALIALLHPAVELAREFAKTIAASNVDIVEIPCLSDARWDYDPLLAMKPRRAVVLVDVIMSGASSRRLIEALEYLNISVHACLSILSIGRCDLSGIPQLSFCQCTEDEIEEALFP